jgi:hypothetical protein
MYKRKIMGILKYGTRGYAPAKTQAFQEGGTVAVSKATRDDPMSLCYNKRLHNYCRIRASGRKAASSSPGIKNDTFLGLKAGYPLLMTL